MGAWDDLDGVGPTGIDEAIFEDVLTGALDPLDMPPAVRAVSALIDKARQPATSEELAARTTTVPAFALVAQAEQTSAGRRRKSASVLRFPVRVMAIATPVALLGVGVAAATDSLPSSTQAAVSHVLSHVGISVPDPQAHAIVGEPSHASTSASVPSGNGAVAVSGGAVPVPTASRSSNGGLRGSRAVPPPLSSGPTHPAGNAAVACTSLSGNAADGANPPTLDGCSQVADTGGSGVLSGGGLAQAGNTTVTWRAGGTISFRYTSTVPQAKGDQCPADPTSPGNKETEVVLRGSALSPGNGSLRAKVCITSTLDVTLLPGTSFKL